MIQPYYVICEVNGIKTQVISTQEFSTSQPKTDFNIHKR